MAELPRWRGKAVDDLDKIPSTEQEWLEMVKTYSLVNAKLQNLCSYGSFSASTVPKAAFLTVRCIWPEVMTVGDALPYILRTGLYFSEEHVAQATKLINRKLLGLDKLDTLFDVICSQTKTPREWLCTLADGLGPFSMLVSLKRQILDKGLHTAPREEPLPITYAPRKKGHYNASQSSSGQMPDSLNPRHPKRLRLGDFDAIDDHPAPSEPSTPPNIELTEETLDEIPDDIPDPRTPTETLVVDFMVNLLGGLACLLQPLAYQTVCVANAFETTYQFGPLPNDGSIPFSLPPDKNLPEMVIFEAKRAHCGTGQGVTVVGQQSMEHVAYIWKRHKNDQLPRNPRTYHTFMIAQDFLSFYISIGTYDKEYLDYIFSPGDVPVVAQRGKKHFLRIQEFGPFQVDERDEMELLIHIILCLIISQHTPTNEGDLIQKGSELTCNLSNLL
ncbi:hypothetical protein ACO22_00403 [Paracoccidioides brasiliensis]|uniref:Uncharacterized protein n=1 Tax=Paracoccidioides brasiliensis TaxID=121759 RepID=A0A1D2JPJ3_PARBR|nr:hypothetical protein ACO22_00403 [Paracoccidioides brasiliensis]